MRSVEEAEVLDTVETICINDGRAEDFVGTKNTSLNSLLPEKLKSKATKWTGVEATKSTTEKSDTINITQTGEKKRSEKNKGLSKKERLIQMRTELRELRRANLQHSSSA